MNSENLPENIDDVDDSILKEVIECEHNGKDCNQQCITAFKILPDELQFYRQMNLALPRLCYNCRYYERLKKVNVPRLYHRKCMNEGCENEFETAIAPERKEIVYCEKCYQDEFI